MIFCWCHVSLILHVPWSLALLSSCCGSSHLLQLLLTDFRGEIPISRARETEAFFLRLSMDTPPPGFLLPFFFRIIRLLCLLWILQHTRLRANGLSFVFPKMALRLKFVVSPWPTDLGQLSVCAPYISVCVGSIHREPVTGWANVWVRHAECWGPLSQSGGDCRWDILSRWWWACWCSPFVVAGAVSL